MNNELKNVRHPYKLRLIWSTLYIIVSVVVISVAVQAAYKIKTHTLPTGKVQLLIPYSKYLVGETINYTIKNEYNSPIYIINSCPSEPLTVYRQESGKWVRQHDEAKLNDCPDEQRQVSVDAGKSVGGSFAGWHNLFKKPGKYRVVAVIEHYDLLPYQDFEVVASSVFAVNRLYEPIIVGVYSTIPANQTTNPIKPETTPTNAVPTTTTKPSWSEGSNDDDD